MEAFPPREAVERRSLLIAKKKESWGTDKVQMVWGLMDLSVLPSGRDRGARTEGQQGGQRRTGKGHGGAGTGPLTAGGHGPGPWVRRDGQSLLTLVTVINVTALKANTQDS